jgi:hypothetical protein
MMLTESSYRRKLNRVSAMICLSAPLQLSYDWLQAGDRETLNQGTNGWSVKYFTFPV